MRFWLCGGACTADEVDASGKRAAARQRQGGAAGPWRARSTLQVHRTQTQLTTAEKARGVSGGGAAVPNAHWPSYAPAECEARFLQAPCGKAVADGPRRSKRCAVARPGAARRRRPALGPNAGLGLLRRRLGQRRLGHAGWVRRAWVTGRLGQPRLGDTSPQEERTGASLRQRDHPGTPLQAACSRCWLLPRGARAPPPWRRGARAR